MPRIPFICGNWKMNKSIGEAVALLDGILPQIASLNGIEVAAAPPFTILHAASKRLYGSKMQLAAQNVHHALSGAFTGEISVSMLKDVACRYVLVGHSERRNLFDETDESCSLKVDAVLQGGLRVILCVGESLQERESGQTLARVSEQLRKGLATCSVEQAVDVVVAYEPVWAIGTGKTASPIQAQAVHAHLRSELAEIFSEEAAEGIRIQYGGSMKPANVAALLAQPDIDGGLIGGASLTAETFVALCQSAYASI
jgi:triosephosphate isomerase